ncbi:MAG: FAD:protein FMN transferase [Planctomycetota bacterium]|jgi:thiamine biosynthesis lipoprotein|nr:FAD:protein FMN transferase [Planctomycetota bacterium]
MIRNRSFVGIGSWVLATVGFLVPVGCGHTEGPVLDRLSGPTMGTTYRVRVFRPSGFLSREILARGIEERLIAIDRQMSTYRSDSELSRFNQNRSTDWFRVSSSLAEVAWAALKVNQKSLGGFDVTVGPLVDLWGFGSAGGTFRVPSGEEIEDCLESVGSTHLEVRLSPPSLRKRVVDLEVDLSAIAKGFAVDRLCAFLEGCGLTSFLVEIGGEVRVGQPKAGGDPWVVGIEDPKPNARTPLAGQALKLTSSALATSGSYRHFFEDGGKRYSHTLDPRTGRPVEHSVVSVSVVTSSCMMADAWATAFMVLGPEAGYDVAVKENLAAFWIWETETGRQTRQTPSYSRLARVKLK